MMVGTPLMLPGKLADLLNELGFIWPKSDEVKMGILGTEWASFAGEITAIHGQAAPHAEQAKAANKGKDIDKLGETFAHKDRGPEVLKDGRVGAAAIGTALLLAAALVLALKIAVIVQLAILLAQIIAALAAAGPTFGASSAWIPVAYKLAQMAINFLISQAIKAILT